MKENDPFLYDPSVLNKLRENEFKFDAINSKILENSIYGKEW